MTKLVECPDCQRRTFDRAAGQCTACGLLGGETDVLDETKLAALLYNVRLRMETLGVHQFEQITAALSPRPGMGDEDAILFTEETCHMTHRYLVEHGILCIRIDVTTNNEIFHSLAFAHQQTGLDRCVRLMRKFASHTRSRLHIVVAPDTIN